MLKLTKYELIKTRVPLGLVGALFAILEGYFLYGVLTDKSYHAGIAAGLLAIYSMTCFFIVFAMAINNYSKELASKSSYLIFMTPNSTFKIVLSKMLSTLLVGVVIVAIITILAVIDMSIMFDKFSSLNNWKKFFEYALENMGINTALLLPTIIGYIIEFLINFFSIVTMIYLAITLSSTLLQNSKFKGFLSFALVVLFTYLMIKAEEYLPVIYNDPANSAEIVLNLIPAAVFELFIMIGFTIGSAKLLEKKVSL